MITHEPSKRTLASRIEWMRTASERNRGLLKYQEAPENYAAVFKLPLGGFLPLIHTFRMRFSIDLVFCDSQKQIVYLTPLLRGTIKPEWIGTRLLV